MSSIPKLQSIAIESRNGVAIIKFNTPKTGNALNTGFVIEWLEAIRWASASPDVNVIVQTGEGKFFTTGKQLTVLNTKEEQEADNAAFVKNFRQLNEAFITCEKVLIAAVNGPGIGYGTTCLGLHDLVYSVPDAYFFTPFMKWGFCAEGCSSYTFPRLMGHNKAAAMLLAEERMSAEQLVSVGLVTKVLPKESFFADVMAVAERVAAFPAVAVQLTKSLMVKSARDELIAVNHNECTELLKRFNSKESNEAISAFLKEQDKKKKSKL